MRSRRIERGGGQKILEDQHAWKTWIREGDRACKEEGSQAGKQLEGRGKRMAY
jgi:hypothetical protein